MQAHGLHPELEVAEGDELGSRVRWATPRVLMQPRAKGFGHSGAKCVALAGQRLKMAINVS